MADYSFDEISRQIVDDYLRDIVFIDEKAYVNQDGEDSFNAAAVSQCFAKSGKLCTIYAPIKDVDIDFCTILADKADVLVVDWRLTLDVTKELDENADAADDIRGEYTLQLLKTVLHDAGNDKFKLIVVYTGETDLEQIFENIGTGLSEFMLEKSSEDFSLSSSNIEIVVRAKNNAFVHKPEWNKFVIEYENLPSKLVEIFTKKIKGLLPNYALSAITEIRKHTPQILSAFSKDLDAAYLGHEVSIPNKEDAQQLLNTCFGSAISELLQDVAIPMHKWYEQWVDAFVVDSYEIENGGKKIKISADFCKSLFSASGTSLHERLSAFNVSAKWANKLVKESSSLFGLQGHAVQNSCSKFAKITQNKNIFGSKHNPPILTLGTVVRLANTNSYFVCIQQGCDSHRIPLNDKKNGSGRDFLFLSLKKCDQDEKNKIKVMLNDFSEVIVETSSYSICKMRFLPQENGTPIYGKKEENQWVFESTSQNAFAYKYIWQFDIKESYALQIVNKYASQLTRVGVDLAESMRTNSEK